jgi:anti-sigma factor ChrR (cupin superfamily)
MQEALLQAIPQDLFEELQTMSAFYALSTLPSRDAQAFEERLREVGRALAREVATFDAVLGALALGTAEHAPPAATREKLLARIAVEAEAQRAPRHAAQFLNLGVAEGRWHHFGAGVEAKQLFKDRAQGTVTYLLKLAPGAELPPHHHQGAEQCYVLEGDIHTNELRFGAGDFHVALPGSKHEMISSETGALVLIVAPDNYEPR